MCIRDSQQTVQRLDRRHLAQTEEAQQLAVGAAQHPLLQLGAALDHLAQRQCLAQLAGFAFGPQRQRLAARIASQRRRDEHAALALVDAQAQLFILAAMQAEAVALAGQVGLAQVVALHLLEAQQVAAAVVGEADAHGVQLVSYTHLDVYKRQLPGWRAA